MLRKDVIELHCITSIKNLPSMLQHGILSHRKAERMHHESVANADVQQRRAAKIVPGGRSLHDYANLYFNARNTMLYSLLGQHKALAILRISTDVLDLPGVIITDPNAASWPRWLLPSTGLSAIDKDKLFAESWIHTDEIETKDHRLAMCAEVLVPDRVEPKYIIGAFTSCEDGRQSAIAVAANLSITINAYVFFQGEAIHGS